MSGQITKGDGLDWYEMYVLSAFDMIKENAFENQLKQERGGS